MLCWKDSGRVLLSRARHSCRHRAQSALRGLTPVFGVGNGVTPSLWRPENLPSRPKSLILDLRTGEISDQLNKQGSTSSRFKSKQRCGFNSLMMARPTADSPLVNGRGPYAPALAKKSGARFGPGGSQRRDRRHQAHV